MNRYQPAPHPRDGFALRKAEIGPHLGWSASLAADYANDPLVYENTPGSSDSELVALVSDQLTAHAIGTLGLFDVVQFAVDVPLHLVMKGQELGRQPTATGFGPGDLRLGAMFALHHSTLASVAISGTLSVGTGERGDDRPGVAGDSGATFAPLVHAAVHVGAVTLLGEVGARWRDDAQFAGVRFTDVIEFGLGAELQLVPKLLSANLETQAESPLDDVGDRGGSLLSVLLGMKLAFADHFVAGAGAGTGLLRGYGAPDARLVFSFGYAADDPYKPPPKKRDPLDEASKEPAPSDAQPTVIVSTDEPPPVDESVMDSDGDGIADLDDSCPAVPGGPDESGCSRVVQYDAETGAITIMSRGIVFADAAPDLRKSPALAELLAFLKANPKLSVRIESHVPPPSGRNDSAISLSVRRATSVGEYMVAQGVVAERLEVMGCGDRRPIAPQRGSQRSKNERVELWVIDPLPAAGIHTSYGCIGHGLGDRDTATPPAAPPAPTPVAPASKPAASASIAAAAPVVAPAPAPAIAEPAPSAMEPIATLRFDEGSAEIKAKSAAALDELASKLRSDAKLKIAIVGHASEASDAADAQDLSARRADAVRAELAQRKVPASKLRTLGCGHTRPVAPNNVPWGRKKNDRVEVLALDPAQDGGVESLEGCVPNGGT